MVLVAVGFDDDVGTGELEVESSQSATDDDAALFFRAREAGCIDHFEDARFEFTFGGAVATGEFVDEFPQQFDAAMPTIAVDECFELFEGRPLAAKCLVDTCAEVGLARSLREVEQGSRGGRDCEPVSLRDFVAVESLGEMHCDFTVCALSMTHRQFDAGFLEAREAGEAPQCGGCVVGEREVSPGPQGCGFQLLFPRLWSAHDPVHAGMNALPMAALQLPMNLLPRHAFELRLVTTQHAALRRCDLKTPDDSLIHARHLRPGQGIAGGSDKCGQPL